jgi:ribonuclease R
MKNSRPGRPRPADSGNFKKSAPALSSQQPQSRPQKAQQQPRSRQGQRLSPRAPQPTQGNAQTQQDWRPGEGQKNDRRGNHLQQPPREKHQPRATPRASEPRLHSPQPSSRTSQPDQPAQGRSPQRGQKPDPRGKQRRHNQPPARPDRFSQAQPSSRAQQTPSAPPHAAPKPEAPRPDSGPPPHWRDALAPLLAQANYQPLDDESLASRLKIAPQELGAFRDFLAEQERTGGAMRDSRGRVVSAKALGFSVGHLQMNERGFGFLVASNPAEPDFYIGGDDTANALHGDLVLARVKPPRDRRDTRMRGEVVRLLQRKRKQLVGVLNRNAQFFYVRPDEPRIPYDVRVSTPPDPAPLGQKVVVELEDWENPRAPLRGRIELVLGSPEAPGVDLLSIIHKYDLPTSFPEAVEQQAAEIPALIAPTEIERREDFRPLFTFTIDPDDAKDFDDALSHRVLPDGQFEVYIHIADVSHYVTPGSPLDVEGRARGNSVYLVDRVIPMLPEKLSNGLCSLQPNVDRLVKTAIVTLDAQGEIRGFRFAEGVIHSTKRFTYQEAFAQLQKPADSQVTRDLHAFNAMAQTLRRRRFARGALDLEMSEIKVRLDANGRPVRLEKMENDLSHQLIEEFMLLANEVVALEIKRRGRPGIYRIHENPDPTRLEEFRAQAKAMGFPCGDLTKKGEIQKLLESSNGKPGADAIKIGLLKSLKRAVYSPKPLGHFGLSKINYTHFTSPIRRYSDLVVHRILFERGVATGYDELSRLALHLSTTERTAAEAEQESVKLKKLEYFQDQARAQERAVFSAMILEVREKGLLVQLPEFQVQGLVPTGSGDFVFQPQRLELFERRSKKTYRAGQTVSVEVASVDLTRNQIDFRLAGENASSTPRPPARRGR